MGSVVSIWVIGAGFDSAILCECAPVAQYDREVVCSKAGPVNTHVKEVRKLWVERSESDDKKRMSKRVIAKNQP